MQPLFYWLIFWAKRKYFAVQKASLKALKNLLHSAQFLVSVIEPIYIIQVSNQVKNQYA